MKLRLRSLESKETLKIEVPNSCSLQQLKDTISRAISSSSSSSSSLHLSLNRKDEIEAPSPDESLHSLGIAAGDLVFYTLNPTAFSPQTETLIHKSTSQETDSREGPTIQDSSEIDMVDAPPMPKPEKPATLENSSAEAVDMVDGSSDEAVFVGKSNSEPSFAKRVLKEAIGYDVTDLKLLVLAVHAVILESGFVRVDKVSGMAVNCSHILDEWPSSSASILLRYTLPEILTIDSCPSQTVLLRFQTLGHLLNVYGSLSGSAGSGVYRVCLDKLKLAKPLELMLSNCESKGNFDDGVDDQHGSEVFELWKMVKDMLALPLLIDLCEKAGFDTPPCLMRLPTELKLMILEHLPGVDVAKVACTCSELRYLSSNTELWKKKFEEEFGQVGTSAKHFKKNFAVRWDTKKRSERQGPILVRREIRFFPPFMDPMPFGRIPVFRSGDYDPVQGLHQAFPPCFPPYSSRGAYFPPCNRRGGFNH